ncbi:MAG: hypothetical protein GC160_08430 [Acidobacteria bacterium]|nr:hypothetical protein [Acidobacteriota bacterium]
MTREQALERIHDPRGLPRDAAERRALERWLDSDPELREQFEQQQSLFAVLDEWADPQPSQGFDAALYRRIAEEAESRTSWRQRLFGLLAPRFSLATAALAAALALAVLWPHPEARMQPQPVEKAALSGDEVEYIEALDQALDDVDMLVDFDAFAPGAVEDRS